MGSNVLPVTIYMNDPESLTLNEIVTVYDLSPERSFQVVGLRDGRHGVALLSDLARWLFPEEPPA